MGKIAVIVKLWICWLYLILGCLWAPNFEFIVSSGLFHIVIGAVIAYGIFWNKRDIRLLLTLWASMIICVLCPAAFTALAGNNIIVDYCHSKGDHLSTMAWCFMLFMVGLRQSPMMLGCCIWCTMYTTLWTIRKLKHEIKDYVAYVGYDMLPAVGIVALYLGMVKN